MSKKIDITLLCKVVDNFGDIGVVYRLTKALSSLANTNRTTQTDFPEFSFRLVVDNLHAFSLLAPQIDEKKDCQTQNGWQIFQWNANDLCTQEFQKDPPQIILECFQCGRPDWLEHLLFDVKFSHTVQIIMLDYLTAEEYAETFHCLPSLTRSAKVQKVNFMPGFTSKTGGLILEGGSLPPSRSLKSAPYPPQQGMPLQRPLTPFEILFFSYEKNLSPIVRALKKFNQTCANGNLNVLLASGAGFNSFKVAYQKEVSITQNSPFTLTELPFLPQEDWDKILFQTPILFIRGEDSLSRACLSGSPFVWHAYPQSDEYQLVKVNALLKVMKPFFLPDVFSTIEKCWQLFNSPSNEEDLESAVFAFLEKTPQMSEGFKNFSKSLIKNGDLASHLMTFILKNAIISE